MANTSDDLILKARKALESPDLQVFRVLANQIIERLKEDYRRIPPTPDNLYKLNELYGRANQLEILFGTVDVLANPKVYPTTEEFLSEK